MVIPEYELDFSHAPKILLFQNIKRWSLLPVTCNQTTKILKSLKVNAAIISFRF